MYIDEKTAQLILDAIAWSNQDFKHDNAIATARADFIRFCRDRGIEGVERKVIVSEDR